MTKLRGKPPEKLDKRLKLFLFGEAKSWKTSTAIQFPNAYLIDCEGGAENDQYVDTLLAGGGVRFETSEMDDIIGEVMTLLTEKHPFRTLIIDPITVPYALACDRSAQAKEDEAKGLDGTEFGRHKVQADRKMKRLLSLLVRLDMNVILIAHAKTKWEKQGTSFKEAGVTWDGYGKLEYVADLILQTMARGDGRVARVYGSRITGFPEGEVFALSYNEIANRYGREHLEREAQAVTLASADQVALLTHMVGVLKVDPEIVQKWLDKAGAEGFAELPAEVADKLIAWCKARLEPEGVTS